ncbi:methyltransferase [Glutamicibacter halophytocola]|uniref:Methyltransferase n=2 Tax=Glutamicibacter halophytocola TaxID=1933880 RepID=A0ABX5Y935_9MICC|nr:methyltransferase [Glutamicibacter halophytocola]MBF6673580.1 methyltransferase [Glutamicibacter sp. FBE19]QDY66019.1 methyltransferase [Glutamicibacter halophytocola]
MNAAEFSALDDTPQSADQHLLDMLAKDLNHVGYGYEKVAELLGEEAAAAFDRDQIHPALRVLERQKPQSPLVTVVRLFQLGQSEAESAINRAFSNLKTEGLLKLGLIEAWANGFRATLALSLHSSDADGELWVAHDLGAHQRPGVLRTDHVLGIGQASLTLAQLTIRSTVDRALDLGTGCGIQLFHLLSHAQHVTATDLSKRALGFARFNLLLNHRTLGLDPQNLESRVTLLQGSLFEPVEGQRFDLIASNPPFVITPRSSTERAKDRFTYRDGGMAGDRLVSTLIEQAPEFLNPGGSMQMLSNWEIPRLDDDSNAPWDARVRQWFGDQLDVWVIEREQATPSGYAETWLRDSSQTEDQASYIAAYNAYLDDFESRNVAAVGFGLVYFRRPDGQRPVIQSYEQINHSVEQPLAPTLQRDIAMADELGRAGEGFKEWHLLVADDVTEERHQRPGAEHPGVILLRQGAGLRRTELLDTAQAGFVSACDGDLSVFQLVNALDSLIGEGQEDFADRLYEAVKRLLLHGMLRKM